MFTDQGKGWIYVGVDDFLTQKIFQLMGGAFFFFRHPGTLSSVFFRAPLKEDPGSFLLQQQNIPGFGI